MTEIIAYCGYRCDLCPAYIHNYIADDKNEISDSWEKYFGFKVPPEIFGDGCTGCHGSRETLDKECPVRPCALQKKVITCAHCNEFICEKCQSRAELLKNCLQMKAEEIPETDYIKYIEPFDGIKHLKALKKN